MVSDAEILAATLQTSARIYADGLLAKYLPADLRRRRRSVITVAVEAGIGGCLLALVDAGLLPPEGGSDHGEQAVPGDDHPG